MPKGEMTNEDIIKYFQRCMREIEDETKVIRGIWEKLHDQYMCKKDWGKKKDWQFKVYIPVSTPVIKKATRMIKQILLRAGDYFDFQAPVNSPIKKKLCQLTKRVVETYLQQAKFIDRFSEALESGFALSMMILKLWVADEQDHFVVENRVDVDPETGEEAAQTELVWNTSLKLKIKPINPFNFFFSSDKSIQIEREYIKLPDLKRMIDNDPKDDDGASLYNKKVYKKIINNDYGERNTLDEETTERLTRLNLLDSHNESRKDVVISHFWGPLIDKDNNIKMEMCNFIVVNEEYLLMKPRENPYWHGKSPYVFDSPTKVIFRSIGKGITEDIMGVEDAIVDFVNLQLDNLMWQLLGVREVDEMALTETTKAELRELYPGKLVKKRAGYSGNAFEFHELGVNPDKAMSMLNELKYFSENHHNVTEYVKAMSSSSDTATEYSGKKQSALSDFQSIAQDIESGFMVECIDMARDLIVQYLIDTEEDDRISAVFAENELVLSQLSEAQRREMIVTDIDFIPRGLSVFFERENLLNKLGSYVKFLNAMPDQAKAYPNWQVILQRVNDSFSFDKQEEMLFTEEQVQQKIKEAQAQQQKMIQAQAQQAMAIKQQEQQFEMKMLDKKLKVEIVKIMSNAKSDKASRETDTKMQILQYLMEPDEPQGGPAQ